MVRFGMILAALMLVQGCTLQQYAKAAVDRYCGLRPEARMANRSLVAAAVAPNRINIDCAGDPAE